MKRSEKALPVRDVVLFGLLGAMTFGAKYVMSPLPNIEPVSLCVMLYAVVFGRKWIYPVYLYVAMEILFYGISLWNINYLYIWAVLAVAAHGLKNMDSALALRRQIRRNTRFRQGKSSLQLRGRARHSLPC